MPDFLTDVEVQGNLTEQGQRVFSPNNMPPYSFMKRGSTDTSNANPSLDIPWQTAVESNGSDITWASGNNTRLTIATTGYYKVGGVVAIESTTERAQAGVQIRKNGTIEGIFYGTAYIRNSGDAWPYWAINFGSEPFALTAADYIEISLRRTTGSTAYNTGTVGTITHYGAGSRIWVERVG